MLNQHRPTQIVAENCGMGAANNVIMGLALGMADQVRERTDCLDAAGNTTALIGKDYAIGSAAFVSLALFSGYMAILQPRDVSQFAHVDIMHAFPSRGWWRHDLYWFSAMTMGAVGRAAHQMKSGCGGELADSAGRGTGTGAQCAGGGGGGAGDGVRRVSRRWRVLVEPVDGGSGREVDLILKALAFGYGDKKQWQDLERRHLQMRQIHANCGRNKVPILWKRLSSAHDLNFYVFRCLGAIVLRALISGVVSGRGRDAQACNKIEQEARRKRATTA